MQVHQFIKNNTFMIVLWSQRGHIGENSPFSEKTYSHSGLMFLTQNLSGWEDRHQGWTIKYPASANSFLKSLQLVHALPSYKSLLQSCIYASLSHLKIYSLNYVGLIFLACESKIVRQTQLIQAVLNKLKPTDGYCHGFAVFQTCGYRESWQCSHLFLGHKTQPEVERSVFDVYGGRKASGFTPNQHCWGIGFKSHNEFDKIDLNLVC